MAAAISSRKLSLPNVFCMRPGARIHAAGNGVSTQPVRRQLVVRQRIGNAEPELGSGRARDGRTSAASASTAASSVTPERCIGRSGMNMSDSHAVIRPWSSMLAR